jgi:hypothetical protein
MGAIASRQPGSSRLDSDHAVRAAKIGDKKASPKRQSARTIVTGVILK